MKSKKRATPPREVRTSHQKFEVRRKADGTDTTIVGYASVFPPAQSRFRGWFEQIDPHAFDKCLATDPDVRALFNHDPSWILGRTKAGTLKLSVDSVGLRYEISPSLESTQTRDLLVALERGDVDQSSFGMFVRDDEWEEREDGTIVRTILEADLFDVSPVTFPAYPDATSGLRASLRSCPTDIRCKLKCDDLNDAEGEEENDYRPECDPESDDYDPDADCSGDDDDEEEDDRRRDLLRIRTLFAHRVNA